MMKKVVIVCVATVFVLAVAVCVFATYEAANFSAGRVAYQRAYKAMTSKNYERAVREFTISLRKPNTKSDRA